jgi:hypothetical protein
VYAGFAALAAITLVATRGRLGYVSEATRGITVQPAVA